MTWSVWGSEQSTCWARLESSAVTSDQQEPTDASLSVAPGAEAVPAPVDEAVAPVLVGTVVAVLTGVADAALAAAGAVATTEALAEAPGAVPVASGADWEQAPRSSRRAVGAASRAGERCMTTPIRGGTPSA